MMEREYALKQVLRIRENRAEPTVLSVRSNSMNVLFREADRLITVAGREPRLDAVCVFWSAGRLVAHRLVTQTIQQGVKFYVTKGDVNRALDPPIAESEIVGTVVAIERCGYRVELDRFPSRAIHGLLAISARFVRHGGWPQTHWARLCERITILLGRLIWLWAREISPQATVDAVDIVSGSPRNDPILQCPVDRGAVE